MNRFILIAAAVATTSLGCSSEEEPPTQEAYNICENGEFETAYEEMTVGLTKAGDASLLQVALMDFSPSPPVEDAENVWSVQLLDMAGNPLPDATLMSAEPFMPDHGHGSQQQPVIGETNSDGYVEIDNILFQMPGVWTMTFTVDDGTGNVDAASFGLCISS